MSDPNKIQYLTQAKKEALEKEYTELKKEKMPEIAERIDEARQLGDLSENAEYHTAKDEMAWARSRLHEIQHILNNAQIIESDARSLDVQLGTTVTVEVGGKKRQYTIVGAQEADPMEKRISNESPLGEAFLGKKKGDTVEVKVPAGIQEYKIIDVS